VIAVGWSGGADSTALLLSLQQAGHHVHAWHVDHAWRDTSQHEAERLAQQAKGWNIPFHSARLPSPSGKNREAEARRGRLFQFQRWSVQYNIQTLCLAQHLEDQAETVCMRLLQGAAAAGCQGMLRQRRFNILETNILESSSLNSSTLTIVRPLLHISVQELRQALSHANIVWFEDPSNTDLNIWRNRIRHRLFPAIARTGIDPHQLFQRWQQQAQQLSKRIDHECDAVWQHIRQENEHHLILAWPLWLSSSAPIRARLLQRLIATLLGEGVTPGRRHITLVETWTTKHARGGVDLSRCRLYRSKGYLHIQPAKAVCSPRLSRS